VTLEHRQKHIVILICIGIIAGTLVAYEPIRHNGFVNYDDNEYITENPHVNGGITRDSIIWAFTKPHASNWHPLTWLSHMLDCEICGLNPPGHHITSVLIHTVNGLVLFWLLTRMTGAMWISAFLAGVFALHPIQVEAVAWAAERKTVLSGLFWLLTMAAYVRYARQPRLGRYVVVLLVFGLCIMTKPVVVTLPLALLLLDYWPLDRVRWGHPAKNTKPAESNRKSAGWLIAEKAPLLAMSAFLSAMTFAAQTQRGIVPTLTKMPLDYRIANMFLSYIRYIGKMIAPSGLAVCYPYPLALLSDTPVIICGALFVLITVLSIFIGRRKRYVAVGWLWYVGTLVPTIGMVQAGAQGIANRYMYIPMLGLLIIIGWAIKDFVVNRPRMKIAVTAMGVIALFSMLILTRMQVRHWRDNLTLFDYALKVTKDNPVAENIYGCSLFDAGRLDEAQQHLSNAVRISPVFTEARNQLAKVYLKEGKYDEAIANLYEIVRRNEGTAEIYYNMAAALEMQKKYDDAIKYYAKSLELAPEDPAANKRMGIALLAAGKANEAIVYAQRACELTGDKDAECLETLASGLAAGGSFDEATRIAEKALTAARISGRENLILEIQKQVELYRAGMRDRQK
jgi:protein O-mannosyl-transferase